MRLFGFACLGLIIMGVVAAPTRARIDAEDAVGLWLFDEGDGQLVNDSSGKENHGTFNGAPEWVQQGAFGAVLNCARQGHVLVKDSDSLDLDKAWTIAIWVNINPPMDRWQTILNKRFDVATNYVIRLSQDRGRWEVMLNNGGWVRLNDPNPPQGSEWVHLAGTYNGTDTLAFFVNGEQVATRSGVAPPPVNNIDLRLGSYSGSSGGIDGMMDEAAIFKVALEPDDIMLIKEQGLAAALGLGGAGFPKARSPSPEDGASHENTWVTLSWKAGDSAVSHDVYLGESFDDVNNGAGDTFRGNQIPTELFVGLGLPGDPYPGGLVPGTTYYWRIDEVNNADPNSPWKGDVWSFLVPPRKAYEPSPADGAKYIATEGTILSWTAGMDSILHAVYFGDNFDNVSNTGGGALQSQITYDPGPLELEKTYYWRVDEFDGAATHRGDVWSFTTTIPGLGTAVVERWDNIETTDLNTLKNDPRYPNDPDVVETVTQFAWDGPDADDYGGRIEAWLYVPATGNYTFWLNTDDQGELWLSTDEDSGNIKLIAKESTYSALNTWGAGEEQSKPIPLIGGERYYIMALWKEGTGGDHCQVAWQGPGIATRTIIPGSNLSAYEPLNAHGATPANNSTGVSQTPVLQWKPGLEAASSEVYFGADADAVRNATKASPEYKGTRALGAESYSPGMLAWATTYYWRVDEVNNANPNSPWVGAVWSFTTVDFLIVDDIESYNDLPETDPASKRIYLSWIDGFGTTTNGSLVGNLDVPLTERSNVHGGSQAMPLSYDNNLKFSEATLTLTGAARDWTREGVGELSLWFRGAAANAPEVMYVALNGTAAVYHSNPNVTRTTAWTEWVIPLQAFADQGVNLANVTSVTIGFGTRGDTTTAGGTGQMYFDDIRLYRRSP